MKNEPKKSLCQEEVYQKVFFDLGNSIRNYIYSKLGDMDLAEDITQDTFITLWQNCADTRIESVKPFLYRIAKNKIIDHVRHQKVALVYKAIPHPTVNNQTPQFEMEVEEYRIKLNRVLNQIPEPNRVVFLMNRIEKLKYYEIAERLDISVKAVEKRMSKALLIIKKQLGKKI